MKVTEFSEETKVDMVTPDWAKYMEEGDFISYMPSYTGGTMRDKFEECKYPGDGTTIDVGEITYYLFDPIKVAGAPEEGKYPLIVFIHGATNALDGRICVSHSGGEMFATPEYQSKMGPAYILVPLANEKVGPDGNLCESWNEKYMVHLKGIIEKVISENEANVSMTFIGGGSSGGYVTFEMCKRYPEMFKGAFPVSAHELPTIDELKRMEETGMHLIYACGRYDEFGCYNEEAIPSYEYIKNMENGILFIPKWVKNGDGGIASLYFGIEMGQHCMITQMQANLMFDDGTPMCQEIPDGMTGWFKSVMNS